MEVPQAPNMQHAPLPTASRVRITRCGPTRPPFQALPFIVGENPHINKLYTLLWEALQSIKDFPPIETAEDEKKFTKHLVRQCGDTEGTTHLLGWGMKEVRMLPSSVGIDYDYMDEFIDEVCRDVPPSQRMMADSHAFIYPPPPRPEVSPPWSARRKKTPSQGVGEFRQGKISPSRSVANTPPPVRV